VGEGGACINGNVNVSCNNMRPSIIIALFLTLSVYCLGQTAKEQAFTRAVKQIVTAFSKQDSVTIAKFIDKKIGLYQLDRIGVFDHYNHFETLSFSDTTYPQVLFKQSKGIQFSSLKYAKLPTFDCDKEIWSKTGLFVDTTKTNHLVSKICKDRNKYVPDNIPNKTIQYFYDLENKSRRIVLSDRNKIELVFYLSYLNGKWVLTIVDNVSSDCSA